MAKHCKKQLMNTKLQITAEFEQLHQFLKREEEGRLAALQEEEEQKTKTITLERKDIRAQISVVSEVISAVKRDLAQEDNAAFLASYELTQTGVRHLCSRPDPQLRPGGLVDVAKHLGNLSFRVWEKMREERIKFTPVILDPNTASRSLYLSEDLTSVRIRRQHRITLTTQRGSWYTLIFWALRASSQGNTVGRWRRPSRWTIGVSKESVDRKGERGATPENGIWCLFYRSEKYTNGSGKLLTLKKIPQRIRVVLDCDRGEVSFYNPEGNDHIYTYEATFSEKIYPYFSVGPAGIVMSMTGIVV
ncbi:LOW QUALITY PROTEIN: hypothetical protein CRUP_013692 [Coryphaenoides rupestris]|nr:LOW QUALITY PROTEIN: hypothetical protein CRUP_013692 [Coryphaenoides rupestris]